MRWAYDVPAIGDTTFAALRETSAAVFNNGASILRLDTADFISFFNAFGSLITWILCLRIDSPSVKRAAVS